ncbi:hypothetical protein [Methyloligella solikamskensis]|uniref:Uncharacterized protein n=1 Tax=Methyloligella solikamskensis TaxID=1177756 RepID=A0ABW3JE26_9HYPH
MVRNPDIAIAEMDEVAISQFTLDRHAMATDWGAIFGGALAAVAVSIILFTAGSGFGLSTVEPWSFTNDAPETFAIGAGIWLIVMQWLSSGFGGYLAGRLRSNTPGLRTDEVFFRDSAHGLLAWALATLLVAALFAVGTVLASLGAADAVTAGAGAAAEGGEVSKETAKQVAEAAANFSIFTAISLLIGGFIGGVAGALGGYHRDEI